MSLSSQAIGFALLSLLFAGCLDVVYKRYSLKQRSRGVYLAGMGIVWGGLQILTLSLSEQTLSLDPRTLAFGLVAGIFITLSNLMLIESLTHLQVSLGSTIYRLNTIGVVILSALFLGESLELIKLLGITSGIIAALLFYQRSADGEESKLLNLFFWIVVLASLFRAGFSVVTKAAMSLGASSPTLLLIAALCWIVGGFCYALLREKRLVITSKKIAYIAVSGVLVYLIVSTLFAALEREDASVVVPIANLSFIMAFGISVLLGLERLTVRKCMALAFAGASIIWLAQLT